MKKLTLALVFAAVCLLGFGVSASFVTPPADTPPADTVTADTGLVGTTALENAADLTPACARSLPLATAGFTFPGPNNCGDPCSPDGARFGCIDRSSEPWRRVICYCINGSLAC